MAQTLWEHDRDPLRRLPKSKGIPGGGGSKKVLINNTSHDHVTSYQNEL